MAAARLGRWRNAPVVAVSGLSLRKGKVGVGAGGARSASSALAVRRRRVGAGPCVRAWRLPASGGGATPRWSQFPGLFPQRKGVWG